MHNEEQWAVENTGDRDEEGGQEFQLRLYVIGASSNSVRAITNIKNICEKHLPGKYSLEIIDIYQQKEVAEHNQIIALPLLIKTQPLPQRRLIGDMSDTDKVLRGLGLIA
jgi:circadian clock protein KaiB